MRVAEPERATEAAAHPPAARRPPDEARLEAHPQLSAHLALEDVAEDVLLDLLVEQVDDLQRQHVLIRVLLRLPNFTPAVTFTCVKASVYPE